MIIAFYGLTGLLIVLTAAPAALKLAGAKSMREGAEHFHIPWSRYRLIGVLEAAAAIGVAAGLGWRAVGLASVVAMVALMLGAIAFHLRSGDKIPAFAGAVTVLVFCLAYLFVGVAAAA